MRKVTKPQAVITVATLDGYGAAAAVCYGVTKPQAVITVATLVEDIVDPSAVGPVTKPQAVITVATFQLKYDWDAAKKLQNRKR